MNEEKSVAFQELYILQRIFDEDFV